MSIHTYTGRAAFLELLIQEGVTHLFGNPGTTELPLMEVVPQYPQLKYVLGLQESIVLGMADGFSRATGRLTACNLHCAPGLGHAMGALYTAKFNNSPIIVTAGQYEQGYGLTEPLLYEPLVRLADPLVKWAVEVERAEDLPRIVHRAAKIALTPPCGPVFISLPGSILDETVEMDLGQPTAVHSRTRPNEQWLELLANRLRQAKRPVILAGQELARYDCFEQAGKLAELIGAPVYLESVPYNTRFPANHPANMGDITRNQHKVRETLSAYDLLICLGGDLLRMSPKADVEPLPDGMPVVHITERDWELGKNYPTEIAVHANVADTLQALLPILQGQLTSSEIEEASRRLASAQTNNWQSNRQRFVSAIQQRADQQPTQPDYAVWQVVQALPDNVIVVDETLTTNPALNKLYPANDSLAFFGLTSGGLGFGMAGAVGVALGQPDRPVVATIGDGSSLYSIQSLWTAAHFKLPITYVIFNNRSYRIIKDRLQAMRHTDQFVAMDMTDPAVDFVNIANGFGIDAVRVENGVDIRPAIEKAIASGKPNLVEVVIDNGY
ncbi:thiamine pyrophosphate-binding protein [Orrella daihaiensis]|uniref:Thiamine pyrophosphate-binding protein n=1 Tax=Orrella daihaiensis TaxID=2782176 RepID=A0ABY4AHW8_9BURK|nr:thiamine pyrophosphate-dependent enzyme [Orrella daihaiensis]UOD49887.1 thiamine pyrophosphate-binding protein [Orrella daihaiensis]